jgi:hypothetical protein
MSSRQNPIYHRVKITPETIASNNNQAENYKSSSSSSSNKRLPATVQFALHGLVPRQLATPPARTLFFCVASQQLFPTAEAMAQVCADPVDFSRICAKHGRGGEVPRPDFISGYTRALPVAQYQKSQDELLLEQEQKEEDEEKEFMILEQQQKEKEKEILTGKRRKSENASKTESRNSPATTGRHSHHSSGAGGERKRSPTKTEDNTNVGNTKTAPRWVFVAEAKIMVSEQMMSSLLGETTQRFIVLFTSAFFDRTTGGNQKLILSLEQHADQNNNTSPVQRPLSSPMTTGRERGTKHKIAGSAFAQPLIAIKKSHQNDGSTKVAKEFDINQTKKGNNTLSGNRLASSSNNAAPKLSREEVVSVAEISPELITTDLNVLLGPHDRSWLFRFATTTTNSPSATTTTTAKPQLMMTAVNNNNRRLFKARDCFEAAKQMTTHRMHLGDEDMMKHLAKKFNEFLIGATQDCRRFCSFYAARMKVPIVFEQGMRAPQCQAFFQFLRHSRNHVCDKCVPAPPPHLAQHFLAPEFLEERPLLEVIANLSVRFSDHFHKRRRNRQRQQQFLHSSSRKNRGFGDFGGDDDDKEEEFSNSDYDDDEFDYDDEHQNASARSNNNSSSSPQRALSIRQHQQQQKQKNYKDHSEVFKEEHGEGYYGPEIRSVFAPWRIEWLDFLLLTCVETRLWREISTLIERFYELSDTELLKHPEYIHEENSFRINLFANVADIEAATGHYGLELSDAVKIANRCSQFCKASPANRAMVFRIRHMTRVPFVQRILFDPKICMFLELCTNQNQQERMLAEERFQNLSNNNNNKKSKQQQQSPPQLPNVTLGRILWCLLVPLKLQKLVTSVIGSRENGVPMVTTPKVAARQFRAFVLSSSIGDEAFKALCKKKFNGWVLLIRDRRVKRKQALQLQMTVRHSMVQNMDSRKSYYMRWFQFAIKQRNLRKQGKLPPRE